MEDKYDYETIKQIDSDLDHKMAQRICKDLYNQLLNSIESKPIPYPPYSSLVTHRDLFLMANSDTCFRYDVDAVQDLEVLHDKLQLKCYSEERLPVLPVPEVVAAKNAKSGGKKKKDKAKKDKKDKKDKKAGKKSKSVSKFYMIITKLEVISIYI